MVSMKDISAACGVSIATVSKALSDQKDIGRKTKALVHKTAKEMGYSPNSSARTLKTNKSYNLGILFVDESNSGLTHDYFVAVLESFKVTVEQQGYDITFISGSKQRKDKMSYLEHCRGRGLDGVLIACIDYDAPEVIELIQSNLPVVTIDQTLDERISIVSDNAQGIEDLFNYIYECGHRKIAYIHGDDKLPVTKSRLGSFYKSAQMHGLQIPAEYVRSAAYRDTEKTARITGELLDLPDPPTCILFPCDFSGLGGIGVIKSRGLKIPQDISVAGYDGIPVAKYMTPQLTTFNQDTRHIGMRAAQKLIDLIENPKTAAIEHVIIPGELETGATVGRI